MDHDFIIIGSGFGGAVAACRLSEAGFRVLVLERGRRWHVSDFPRQLGDPWLWCEDHPEREHGWLDLRTFGRMNVAVGAGVGGGSLHYANVSIDAQPDMFDSGWPSGITYETLQPFYARVKDMLGSRPVPDNQRPSKMKLLEQAARTAGHGARFQPVDLAVNFDPDYEYDSSRVPNVQDTTYALNREGVEQGTCVHLGNCVIGCDVKARNSLDFNYLKRAENHGTEIRPLHIVRHIEPVAGGYRVTFDEIVRGRLRRGRISGTRVIVAAGSIGSTELLLRCRHEAKSLPRLNGNLGRRWASNTNYLTPAVHPSSKVYLTRGPTITGALFFFGEDDFSGSNIIIEDGGVPNLVRTLCAERKGRRKLWSLAGRRLAKVLEITDTLFSAGSDETARHVMLWFAQGRDEPTGRLALGRRKWWLWGKRRLGMAWDPAGAEEVVDDIITLHESLARAGGGHPLEPVAWEALRALITVHPIGGCSMSDTPHGGVVNSWGEVFGYPGLYVADGSIIPEAIGVNPSKTIAAVAERIAEGIVARGGASSFSEDGQAP